MSGRTIQTVVARYKENVDWTRGLPNVIIYNKGDTLDASFNTMPLPNVGREGHSYYYHIYTHYDELADYTVFVQGNPFDHCPDFLNRLEGIRTTRSQHIPFQYFCNRIVESRLSACPHHPGLPLVDIYNRLFTDVDKQIHRRIFVEEEDGDLIYTFGAGAQFIVSRQRIHRYPRYFYKAILQMLEGCVCPIEGYIIERFHPLIFHIWVPPTEPLLIK
jgi:hypothetical protein